MKIGQVYLTILAFTIISTLERYGIVLAQISTEEAIAQSEKYNAEKITQVEQLRDLSSGDWSYEAIRSLAERSGCMKGFPNRTFQGNRALTRDEFAAGLNSCWETIEGFVDEKFGKSTEDIDTIIREDNTESKLATFGSREEEAESRIAILESSQFSTTTKLTGEVVFGLGSILEGSTDGGETEIDRVPYLGNQITLELASRTPIQ